MASMWHAGVMFVGLTGLPHPGHLYSMTNNLMSALNINLDQYSFNGGNDFGGNDYGGSQGQQVTGTQVAILAAVMVGVFLLIYFLPQIIFACLYKSNVHDKKKAISAGDQTMRKGDFHYKLFACHENMNECMCSILCPMVRYADTYGSINGSFYGSMCTFFGVNTIITIISALVISAAMPPCPFGQEGIQCQHNHDSNEQFLSTIMRGLFFGMMGRAALRQKLGDPEPGAKKLHDFLAWGCCYPCALTQDSVEVDIAADVTVGCPCSVTPGRQGVPQAREVAPSDYEASLLEGGR